MDTHSNKAMVDDLPEVIEDEDGDAERDERDGQAGSFKYPHSESDALDELR